MASRDVLEKECSEDWEVGSSGRWRGDAPLRKNVAQVPARLELVSDCLRGVWVTAKGGKSGVYSRRSGDKLFIDADCNAYTGDFGGDVPVSAKRLLDM